MHKVKHKIFSMELMYFILKNGTQFCWYFLSKLKQIIIVGHNFR